MENARMLDEKLRQIIREISTNTGLEMKKNLVQELTSNIQQNQMHEVKGLLQSLNQALKKM